MVRAKFICISITKTLGGHYSPDGKWNQGVVYSYKFQPVTSGSDENKAFFAATPSGSLELSALREDLFDIQKEYYLDFTAAVSLETVP